MSIIQPVLLIETVDGVGVAVKLQVDTSRVQAETEAAFLMQTIPADIHVERMTVLMLQSDMVDGALDAWVAGLPIHSVDCECEESQELRAVDTDKWGEEWYPDDFLD